MEIKSELTLHEKIVAVQKQLKIAIQNHQVLVAKKQLLQNKDDKIKVHLEVIQWLILNMGRTQASLLNQFRNEIAIKHDIKANSPEVSAIMKKLLDFPDAPKDIPIYKKECQNGDIENKKVVVLKTKSTKSILKANNNNDVARSRTTSTDGSKLKIVFNKKKDTHTVVAQQPKNLQSILKPRNQKAHFNDKLDKSEEGRLSPASVSSTSSGDSKGKATSPPPIDNPIEEIELTEFTTFKMDTRYGKRYEAKMIGSTKVKISCDQINKKDSTSLRDHKEPCPPLALRSLKLKRLDQNPCTVEELDQETFLSLFRLVSLTKCEVLKKKRCERKRRSVAGQSSLYSDYFQPQPKRTYTPRKPAVPINNNAIIVESQAADDDEDEKQVKLEVCIFCHEEGNLEVCNSCSEMYHFRCIPNMHKGNCPSCMAQWTNIPSIVGANDSVGSASNSELIKRYSNEDVLSDGTLLEKKATEMSCGGK